MIRRNLSTRSVTDTRGISLANVRKHVEEGSRNAFIERNEFERIDTVS